jgi:hypothetical protein
LASDQVTELRPTPPVRPSAGACDHASMGGATKRSPPSPAERSRGWFRQGPLTRAHACRSARPKCRREAGCCTSASDGDGGAGQTCSDQGHLHELVLEGVRLISADTMVAVVRTREGLAMPRGMSNKRPQQHSGVRARRPRTTRLLAKIGPHRPRDCSRAPCHGRLIGSQPPNRVQEKFARGRFPPRVGPDSSPNRNASLKSQSATSMLGTAQRNLICGDVCVQGHALPCTGQTSASQTSAFRRWTSAPTLPKPNEISVAPPIARQRSNRPLPYPSKISRFARN